MKTQRAVGNGRALLLSGKQNSASRLSVSAATSMLVAGEIDAIYCQYVEAGAPFDLAAMSPHVVPVLSVGHDLFNAMPPLRAYLSSDARHP